MKAILFSIALLCFGVQLFSQSIEGTWISQHEETGKKESEILIWKEGNIFKGKITKIYDPSSEAQKAVCNKCDEDDSRYMQPVLGLIIIDKLEQTGTTTWEDGEVLDPRSGSVYGCEITWLSVDKIKVRGYLGFSLFGGSQEWIRKE